MRLACVLLCLTLAATATAARLLTVTGTRFSVPTSSVGGGSDTRTVFLAGTNQAWVNYGCDFGNYMSAATFCAITETMRNVSAAGGNFLRVWIFVEGSCIPQWSDTGRVVAGDAAGTLATDIQKMLVERRRSMCSCSCRSGTAPSTATTTPSP